MNNPLGLVAYGDDEEEEEQLDSSRPESHSPPFSQSIAQSGIETLASTSSLPLAGPVAALRVNKLLYFWLHYFHLLMIYIRAFNY